jgi:hypothetical protein
MTETAHQHADIARTAQNFPFAHTCSVSRNSA